jgi:hypothetical protein
MLSVAIAIEPPTESAPAVVQVVARICEQAIGEGRCKPAAGLPPASVVAWYALIKVPEPEASEVSIEFHDRSESGALIETRSLTFGERDSELSRWASAGAVIAAFVAARDSGTEPVRVETKPPPELPPPAEKPAPEPGPAFDLDLALLTGPGLDSGPFRLGALGRGYVSLPQAPGVLGLFSLRYAERSGELELGWWSASCGLGARLGGGKMSRLSAELTGELAFERMSMSAVDSETAEEDEAAQNRFGGRLSVNLALGLTEHLALVAGGEASAMRPSVTIAIGDDAAGREPAFGFGLSAGVRFSTGR